MANFLRRVHNSPKLKALKAKRKKLEAAQKKLSRLYKAKFKIEARRLARKG